MTRTEDAQTIVSRLASGQNAIGTDLSDGRVRIAFYRAKDGNWFDGAINWASSGGGLSHTEVLFPSPDNTPDTSLSFSSTTRNENPAEFVDPRTGKPKPDGTRWTRIRFNPERWVFWEVPVNTTDILEMKRYADSILSARYDWWGVARFVFKFLTQHRDKFFCSEAVIEVCQAGGVLNDLVPHKMSPNSLAKKLGLR